MNKIFIFATLSFFIIGCHSTYLRKNIYSYALGSSELVSLEHGIAVMKARNANDPTSWSYQAAMHGSYVTPSLQNWNQCQHGTFYFLAWHRMYLYYFERILRKASGDNELILPYWNYSDNMSQAALPEIFRSPANSSNSLYESDRDPAINAGGQLDPSVVDYSAAMGETIFTGTSSFSDLGFGGLTVSAPVHFGGPHGVLESQPHDQVHVSIGGLMSDPNTAAQDPIFWLHHCNIDRLWEKWLRQGGGRVNPTSNTAWMNTIFTFYDEDGKAVTLSGAKILNTVDQLNYRYDDEINYISHVPVVEREQDTIPPSPPERISFFAAENVATQGLLTTVNFTSTKSEEFTKFIPLAIQSLREENTRNPIRVKVLLEGITYDTVPKGLFELYVNLPIGEKTNAKSDYYVGNIGLFGFMTHHGEMKGMDTMNLGGSVLLDLTKSISRLQNKNVTMETIKLTIVHRSAIIPKDSSKLAGLIMSDIKIKAITVFGLK
jgi:Common central domain of tyrosinase/Polyphenol oxidase middle domain